MQLLTLLTPTSCHITTVCGSPNLRSPRKEVAQTTFEGKRLITTEVLPLCFLPTIESVIASATATVLYWFTLWKKLSLHARRRSASAESCFSLQIHSPSTFSFSLIFYSHNKWRIKSFLASFRHDNMASDYCSSRSSTDFWI